MTDTLEKGARKVLHVLLQHGYEAYLVGGCVRDKQLQRAVKDYDIATSARPEQVQGLFPRTIPTGLQHGTVSVITNGFLYEVTTFRQEAVYEQFRRPAEVHFIDSLYEDLKRRDFTMNAMALDLDNRLIDPFDGMEDIKNGILRCVGDARERFSEDALRMLRCIRFSAEFDLEAERSTWSALCEQAKLLRHIAMERVRMELERMIAGANPDKAIALLGSSGILQHTKNPLKLAEIADTQLISGVGQFTEPHIRWAYLYLCIGIDPVTIQEEMRVLTFSKTQLEEVRRIIAAANILGVHLKVLTSEAGSEVFLEAELELIWKNTVLTFGKETLHAVRTILSVDPAVLAGIGIVRSLSSVIVDRGIRWASELRIDRLEQLHIGGKELIAHIPKPAGPWIAEVLDRLMRETALGYLANEPSTLLAEAQRLVAHNTLERKRYGQNEY